jgi:thiaminase/transcriptional activator TenA
MTIQQQAASPASAGTTPMLCDEIRAASAEIWNAATEHQFLIEVENDTLPDEKLLYYFIQNVHYIDAAARFSAQAAAKAPDARSRAFALRLLDFGRAEVERQREYIRRLEQSVPTPVDRDVAPSALAYINHLLALAAYGGSLELFVGLLPCEWTYSEFGTRLAPIVRHPVCVDWLATFGGADHNDMNTEYRDIVEHLAGDCDEARRQDLAGIFRTSSRYEWMFWEMAYTLEKWPI